MKVRRCAELERHEPHVWKDGWRDLDCPGLKHRSTVRGRPRSRPVAAVSPLEEARRHEQV